MRTMITGAAGFIGANLARRLAGGGHDVIACTRPGSDRWRLDDVDCTKVDLDIARRAELESAIEAHQPDAIVNAATHGASSWQTDLRQMLEVNVTAVEHLVDVGAAYGIPLLHLGSSSEYGPQPGAPSEDARPAPNSHYAITKLAGTHLVCDGVARRGLTAIVLRIYSAYGPWETPARLMPTLAAALLRRELPPLVDPRVARDFVHVDDVLDLVVQWTTSPVVVDHELPVVNVGSGKQTTIGELVEMARQLTGIDLEPAWGSMDNRAWDVETWQADARRAEDVFGWRAKTPLADGLGDLMEFVRDHDRYGVAPRGRAPRPAG